MNSASWWWTGRPGVLRFMGSQSRTWLSDWTELNESLKKGMANNFRYAEAAAAAKSLQSCPTRCNPIDSSPPGSPIPGILLARTLEWVTISFSKAWKWKVKVKSFSRVQLFAIPWTAAYQAPPSMGFSRQEYWSGVPLPSPYKICYNTNNMLHYEPQNHERSQTQNIIWVHIIWLHLNEIYRWANLQRQKLISDCLGMMGTQRERMGD